MFVLALRLRDVAVRIRQKVARKYFHGRKQHEEDCGNPKRPGPEGHLIHDATCRRPLCNLGWLKMPNMPERTGGFYKNSLVLLTRFSAGSGKACWPEYCC